MGRKAILGVIALLSGLFTAYAWWKGGSYASKTLHNCRINWIIRDCGVRVERDVSLLDVNDPSDRFLNEMADEAHEVWSDWMKYMFRCGVMMPDGSWAMPPVMVERWQRQMNTPYSSLTSDEKDSDLDIAQRYIAVMRSIKQN